MSFEFGFDSLLFGDAFECVEVEMGGVGDEEDMAELAFS
jgi:hypothetical protein